MVPNLTESVSRSGDGRIHVTLTNLSLDGAEEMEGVFADSRIKSVKGTILTGGRKAHNTFDAPEEVHTEAFTAVTAAGDRLNFTIPPRSVMHLEVELA